MRRRQFLLSAMAGGLGASVATNSARAFVIEECIDGAGSPACREVTRHRDLARQIDQMLKERGLSDVERQAALAAATCPFCGGLVSLDG